MALWSRSNVEDKTFRLALHHPFVRPAPSVACQGYPCETILSAREVLVASKPMEGGPPEEAMAWTKSATLKTAAQEFLKAMDMHFAHQAVIFQDALKQDFPNGLRPFIAQVRTSLESMDKVWVQFEKNIARERLACFEDLYLPVKLLVVGGDQ